MGRQALKWWKSLRSCVRFYNQQSTCKQMDYVMETINYLLRNIPPEPEYQEGGHYG